MEKPKVIHVIYSGLGGHANVVFPLLETSFGVASNHQLVFYGVEKTVPTYIEKCVELNIEYAEIQKKPKKYLSAFRKFSTLLKEAKPDTVFVHNSELLIPALRHRNKHNNCQVYYVEHQDNNTKGILLNKLSQYALKKANGVICLTESFAEELRDKYTITVPIHIIQNGINLSRYRPSKTNNMNLLGMASRMMPTKDHETLLKAFKIVLQHHPNTILEIAGDGTTMNEVSTLANQLELTTSVRFLGYLNENEMLSFYERIGVYVLATTSETMSTGILQAMSCALPIITSNIENNKLIIENDLTGWLYINRNSVDLAEKIVYAINHYEQAKQLGLAARQSIIDNYSIEATANKYATLISQ